MLKCGFLKNTASSGPRDSDHRTKYYTWLKNHTCCVCYTWASGYIVNQRKFLVQLPTDAVDELTSQILPYPSFPFRTHMICVASSTTILWMETARLREVKCIAQSHTATKWLELETQVFWGYSKFSLLHYEILEKFSHCDSEMGTKTSTMHFSVGPCAPGEIQLHFPCQPCPYHIHPYLVTSNFLVPKLN